MDIGCINMQEYLDDVTSMSQASHGFSKRPDGFLKGAIGAIDGWLVRIVRPSKQMNGIDNPTTFFRERDSMH